MPITVRRFARVGRSGRAKEATLSGDLFVD
jgi:hypothetical protein